MVGKEAPRGRQVRVNKLSQMAMILEGDVKELEICSGNAKRL